MVRLVSISQASDHLRRDTTDDDNDLLLKIEAASGQVLNLISDHSFIETSGLPFEDSAGNFPDVPRPIQMAVLILVGVYYKDRDGYSYTEGETSPRLGDIIIPRAVHALLDPYRKPLVQ